MHRIQWEPASPPHQPITWLATDGWLQLHAIPARALGAEALVLLGGSAVLVGATCQPLRPGQPVQSAEGALVWSPSPQPLRAEGSTQAHLNRTARDEVRLTCNQQPVRFTGELLLVGRDARCHLQLGDPQVSGFHCALRREAGELRVVDLRSRNGTWVGGQRVHAALLQAPGQVQLGSTVLSWEPPASAGLLRLPSSAMQAVYACIDKVGPAQATVLIQGESGTGKEGVAHALHRCSGRSGKLVVINAATLTPSLAGSELFGHVRGAFTGADQDRDGAFVQAHRGTLFLDEVAELSPPVQAELLRVLEDGAVRPLGSTSSRQVDVRLIAATHRDLRELSHTGHFRADLFHRLHVFPVRLPALRERPEDIEPLVELFLARLGATKRLSPEGRQAVLRYRWPGNIRELRHALHRAVLMSQGPQLEPDDLGLPHVTKPSSDPAYAHILSVFEANAGDVSATARTLGLHRSTVYRHLKRAGVRHP